ncbi:MAG TPA: T9SS type A sorting domain-containing protein [Bacteroidia bacterium]|nr:T9SS type A sorting domain-containing protein [Bacteroidia bacterium]
MFASNIANNSQGSNYQSFTFSNVGEYEFYYVIGTEVNGNFIETSSVCQNDYLHVIVIGGMPSGNFVPPFNGCKFSNIIKFSLDVNSWPYDINTSWIDLGNGNGPQPIPAVMFNINLGYNPMFIPGIYNVVLHLENVCGAVEYYQQYKIYISVPVSTTDLTICEGTSTIDLAAVIPQYAYLEWFSNGIFIGSGNPLTIPAPNITTVYTAQGNFPGNGCPGSDNLIVTVIPEQTIEIIGNASNCNGNTMTYNIDNPVAGAIYNWNIIGGSPSSATGTQVIITWDPSIWPGGGLIEVSSSNFTCLQTGYLSIEPCCATGTEYTFFANGFDDTNTSTDDIYLSQLFANLLPNSNILSPGFFVTNWTGTGGPYYNVVLGGNIIVDMDLTITNNLIIDLMPQTSIGVLPGYTLTIQDGSVLKAACKEMWQGIFVSGGASLVLNSGCIIQDAEIGVFTGANSHLNFGASGAKVRFNKNYFGLAIWNHTSPSNLSIKNTVLECRVGTYSNDELLLSPYAGEMSAVGIFLNRNIPTVTIGEASVNFQNIFDNLLFGVLSVQSNFTLHNNLFQNIKFDAGSQSTNYECDCRCPKGTAVCAAGRSVSNGLLATIGGPGAARNIVTNSYGGFYLYRNMNAVITNNDMLNIESNGMQLFQNYASNGFYDVNHNSLKDVQDHNILIFDNPKITKDITFNEINESYTPQSYLYSTGINIMEFSKPTLSTNILHNDIEKVKFGITTNLVYNLTIDDNEIDLSTDPLAVYGAGIKVENSQKNSITNNTIRAAHRNNWWVDGIRLEYTPKTTVSCNVMERTASGVFLNGDCSDSKIFNNNFRRNYWGYIINSAITGLQQPNMYSDNVWTGPYGVNTDWMGGTYWHTLNQNSTLMSNEMNVRPAGTHTVFKPLPFYANNNMGINTFNLQPDPVSPAVGPIYYANLYSPSNNPYHDVCLAIADTSDGDETMIQQIVNGNYQSPQYNEETNWWLQYQLYIRALADSSLANQYSLQQFIDSMQQASAGRLEHIGKQMNDSTHRDSLFLSQLRAENQAISTFNAIEEQFKWVNEKTIDAAISELDSSFTDYNFNTIDMETLTALAWDCPFDKGPAVFVARALMLKINPRSASFINACETVHADANNQRTGPPIVWEYEYDPTEEHDLDYLLGNEYSNSTFANEIKLYPNPSHSMVTLESNDLITRVEISNAIGQIVLLDYTHASNRKSFDLKDLPKGLYLIKVFNNDNLAVKQLSLID